MTTHLSVVDTADQLPVDVTTYEAHPNHRYPLCDWCDGPQNPATLSFYSPEANDTSCANPDCAWSALNHLRDQGAWDDQIKVTVPVMAVVELPAVA